MRSLIELHGSRLKNCAARFSILFFVFFWGQAAYAACCSKEVLTYSVQTPPVHGRFSTYGVEVVHYDRGQQLPGPAVIFVSAPGHTAYFFEPLMQAILEDPKSTFQHAYAISLPGQGGSDYSFDKGHYGDTNATDTVIATYQVLAQMKAENRDVQVISGWGFGGLVTQLIQSRLLGGIPMSAPWIAMPASSLAQKLGITRTVLLGSSMPAQLPWNIIDSSTTTTGARSLIANSTILDANLGLLIHVPDAAYLESLFSVGTPPVPVPNAPSAQALTLIKSDAPFQMTGDYIGLGYNFNTAQFFTTTRQLPATFGAWAAENLQVVAFNQDAIGNLVEEQNLATFLKPGLHVIVINEPDAVHGMPYSNPKALLRLFQHP
jgi:pimeloyl-ACP methyl ester carboxylesterase